MAKQISVSIPRILGFQIKVKELPWSYKLAPNTRARRVRSSDDADLTPCRTRSARSSRN